MLRHPEALNHRIHARHISQAHAMLPHMGAGAGQGLEDAYFVARLLSHPNTNKGNIEVRCHAAHVTPLNALLMPYGRAVSPAGLLAHPPAPGADGLAR